MRIRSLAATMATLVTLGSAGAIFATSAAAGEQTGTVTVTPHSGLLDQQKVTVAVTGFTAAEGKNALGVECSHQALNYINNLGAAISYCDTDHISNIPIDNTGSGSAKVTIYAGGSYVDKKHDKCDGANPCFYAVASSILEEQYNYTTISFAKSVVTPVKTSTVVTGPSHGTAGHKVKVVAKTTPKSKNGPLSGKVVFTDNGKRVGAVTETLSGRVHLRVKLVKGRNKIVATYKGSKRYLTSKGVLRVKGS